MDNLYGLPVLTPGEVFEFLASRRAIVPRTISLGPMSMDEYLARELGEEQKKATFYAPKNSVMEFADEPGVPYFRTEAKNWSTVFVPLPSFDEIDYVICVGEHKHGQHDNSTGGVMITLPSGGPNRNDLAEADPYLAWACREVKQETGLTLAELIRLSPQPHAVSGRKNTECAQAFLGRVEMPINRSPLQLDANEKLAPFLMSIGDWLEMIRRGDGIEAGCDSATLLALLYLGRIQL